MIGGWGLHKRPASPAGGWASQPWSSKQSVELMSWWKLWCPNGVFFVPGPSEDPKTVNVVNVLKCLGQKKHTHTNYIHMYVYIYNIVYNNYIYIHAYIHLEALGTMKRDEDVFRTSRFNQMFIAVFFLLKCISGWWFQPSWKILVSWDDYSQHMEKEKNVPNNQPNMVTSGKMS
jgi:hypothetical protein